MTNQVLPRRRPFRLFVLGMHRSGTSLAAGLINLLGLPLGREDDLLPPAADNPTGFWESKSLTRANDEILEALGGEWSAPPRLDAGWCLLPELNTPRRVALETLQRVFPAGGWAWKDPRNCLTLPFWLPLVDGEAAAILVYRNPLEVASSLRSRDGSSIPLGLALWERYTRSAFAATEGLAVHVVSYERLVADPVSWCSEVSDFLAARGIQTSHVGAEVIRSFVRPDLRHQAFSADELPEEQRDLHAQLRACEGSHDVFAPPVLPPEPPWLQAAFDEHRRALHVQRRADDAEAARRSIAARVALIESSRTRRATAPLHQLASALGSGRPTESTEDEPSPSANVRAIGETPMPADMQTPLVSIVVLSWNTRAETASCLSNLRRLEYPRTELIVVDNGSSDGSREFLSGLEDIIYVPLDTNRGFAGGHSAALTFAKGDFLALVNSDAVVAPEWLTVCMSAMRENPRAGAVGGRAFRWEQPGDLFSTAVPFWSYQIIDQRRAYAITATSGRLGHAVDSISGAAVVIRRSAVDDVGYFDNDFFAYYEETDLFARMRRRGYTIWYEPRAHVWHQIRRSTRGDESFYHHQMQRNRALFAIKNLPCLRRFFYLYTRDGIRDVCMFLLNRRDVYARASARALWWNVRHLRESLRKRRTVQALGELEGSAPHRLPSDITIVIPCHNYAQYVSAAIESALNQTHKPSRIIVINDGSTDDSLEVIRRYKENVDIVDKENEGVVTTKNLGLAMSDTTWTVFLDADDMLAREYLATVYREAVHTGAHVVYSSVRKFGEVSAVEHARDFSAEHLIDGNFIHNSALIHTEMAKLVGGYKQEMSGGYEDWELYMSLAEAHARFAYVDEPIFLYRQHASGSRNQISLAKAAALLNAATALHPRLSTRSMVSPVMVKHAVKTMVRNPELFVITPVILAVAAIAGLPSFVRGVAVRSTTAIHRYLHVKQQRRLSEDEGGKDAGRAAASAARRSTPTP